MRILFTDDEGTLNCVEATHISFDKTDQTLWFYADDQIYSAKYDKIYAEARIEEAFIQGKLDLSNDNFIIFEEKRRMHDGL